MSENIKDEVTPEQVLMKEFNGGNTILNVSTNLQSLTPSSLAKI